MSKRGQRLREFEKNNRIFNIEEARKREKKTTEITGKKSGRRRIENRRLQP